MTPDLRLRLVVTILGLAVIGLASGVNVLFNRTARLAVALRQLVSLLLSMFHFPAAMKIAQIQGGIAMPITGIVLGATGTFQESPSAPPNAAFPAGTTFVWTSDDSLTTLTPSSDGTQVAVATSTTDPATSFNLTCTSSFTPPGSAAPLAVTANVPLLPPAPPTPTAMAINQLS